MVYKEPYGSSGGDWREQYEPEEPLHEVNGGADEFAEDMAVDAPAGAIDYTQEEDMDMLDLPPDYDIDSDGIAYNGPEVIKPVEVTDDGRYQPSLHGNYYPQVLRDIEAQLADVALPESTWYMTPDGMPFDTGHPDEFDDDAVIEEGYDVLQPGTVLSFDGNAHPGHEWSASVPSDTSAEPDEHTIDETIWQATDDAGFIYERALTFPEEMNVPPEDNLFNIDPTTTVTIPPDSMAIGRSSADDDVTLHATMQVQGEPSIVVTLYNPATGEGAVAHLPGQTGMSMHNIDRLRQLFTARDSLEQGTTLVQIFTSEPPMHEDQAEISAAEGVQAEISAAEGVQAYLLHAYKAGDPDPYVPIAYEVPAGTPVELNTTTGLVTAVYPDGKIFYSDPPDDPRLAS